MTALEHEVFELARDMEVEQSLSTVARDDTGAVLVEWFGVVAS